MANNESRKIKVKVRINPHGIFSVSSATTFESVETKADDVGLYLMKNLISSSHFVESMSRKVSVELSIKLSILESA